MNSPGTITLDEQYYIDVDPLNFILKKVKVTADKSSTGKVNKNAGRRCDITIGYCGTLENALNLYSRELMRNGIHNSATALNLQRLEIILKDIKNAVTKLSLTLKDKQEDNRE